MWGEAGREIAGEFGNLTFVHITWELMQSDWEFTFGKLCLLPYLPLSK